MSDILISIVFGIVQGVTEFLPISSSGHLVILHSIIDFPVYNELAFDVVLHLATLFAVIGFFWRDLTRLLVSWLKSFKGEMSDSSREAWLIILATIPAALAGYFFEDIIENILRSDIVVIIMLILVALLILAAEKKTRQEKEISALNRPKALFIGFAQALALIPGTSRSGITIIAGMGAGLKREEAVKFSFLLSVPIILGAGVKKIPQIFNGGFSGHEISLMAFAFIFAFFSGFLAIKYLLRFTKNNSLNIFAYYRILLALILLVYVFSAS